MKLQMGEKTVYFRFHMQVKANCLRLLNTFSNVKSVENVDYMDLISHDLNAKLFCDSKKSIYFRILRVGFESGKNKIYP